MKESAHLHLVSNAETRGRARFRAGAPEVDTLWFDLDDTLVEIKSRYLQLELSFLFRALPRFTALIRPWRFRRAFWAGIDAMRMNAGDRTNYDAFLDAMAFVGDVERAELKRAIELTIRKDLPALARHFGPIPGARETLLEARELGYRLVLATNPMWPRAVAELRLAWAGLSDIEFEYITHSENSSACKPRVQYYQSLLRELRIAPERCIMIGNDFEKDLPATAVGVDTFLLRGRKPEFIPEGDGYGVGTFADLRAFLRRSAEARAEGIRSTRRPKIVKATSETNGEKKETMRPKIICVTGPDGSGKTTQIARIASFFDAEAKKKVVAVTIWDLLLDPSCRGRVPFDSPRAIDAYLGILHPTSRALFLYHCFHEAMVLAERRKADVLLVNSYWYKYFATEIAHGGDASLLRKLTAGFPAPDLTFYLRVEPDAAAQRKDALSGYETGFDKDRSAAAFVEFQRRSLAVLDGLAKELGWIELDGAKPMDELTATMMKRIAEF